jgi:tetratricopeptide (TPR) repeat protein
MRDSDDSRLADALPSKGLGTIGALTELADGGGVAVGVGGQHLEAYEPREAVEAFGEALAADPDDVEAAAGLVRAHLMLRELDVARQGLAPLLDAAADRSAVHVAHGWVALGVRDDPSVLTHYSGAYEQDVDVALAAFEQALALDPACVGAQRGRATALRAAGRPADARAALAADLERSGPCPPLLVEQAWLARDEERYEEAVEAVHRAVAGAGGGDVDTLLAAAWITHDVDGGVDGDPDFGEHCLRRAEELAPRCALAKEIRGWRELDHAERCDAVDAVVAARQRAQAHFAEALDLLPGHPGAIEGLARVTRLAHGPAAERDLLDDLLDGDGRSPRLLVVRGWVAMALGEPATPYFERAIAESSQVLTAWDGLVMALALDDRGAAAQTVLDEMAGTFGDHSRVAGARCAFAGNVGRFLEGAVAAAELARRTLRPLGVLTPPDAQRVIDGCAQLGDFETAEAVGADTARAYPSSAELADTRAWCAESEGRRHDALVHSRRATRLAPREPVITQRVQGLRRWMRRHPLYRIFGRGIETKAQAAAATPSWAADAVDRFVPEPARPWAGARWHALRWQRERIGATHEVVGMAVLVALLVAVTAVPWVAADVVAPHTRAWWRIGLMVVEPALLGLLLARRPAWSERQRVLVVTGVVAAAGVWPVTSLWSHLGEAGQLVLVAIAAPYAGLVLAYASAVLSWRIVARRIDRPELADAALLETLTLLLLWCDIPVENWAVSGRRDGIRMLDLAARLQSRLLREAVTGPRLGGQAGGVSLVAGQQVERRVAAVAAWTQDLQHELAVPGPASTRRLRRRLLRLLDVTSRRQWLAFPGREPDVVPRRARARGIVRIGLVLQVAALVLAGVVVASVVRSGDEVSPELLTVALGALSALFGSAAVGAETPRHPKSSPDHSGPPERPAASP